MGFSKKELEEKGFTTDQIEFVMAERGKEINAEKLKVEELQKTITDKDKSITELTETAKGLDGTKETLNTLQAKVAEYEKDEADRIENEKQTKLNGELRERFNTIKTEIAKDGFKHDLVENGRFEEFKKALSDEQFKGKGDADIFQAVIKPEDLANPQKAIVTMPGGAKATPTKTEFKTFF